MSSIYLLGGLLEIAYPSDRCLPEAAGQGVRFRPEADVRPTPDKQPLSALGKLAHVKDADPKKEGTPEVDFNADMVVSAIEVGVRSTAAVTA